MAQTARKVERRSEEARTRRLRVVPKTASRTSRVARGFPFFISCLVAFSAIVLFNSAQRALVAQGSVDLNRLEKAYVSARAANEELKVERARLVSPQRIEQVATTKLKMVRPVRVCYIELEAPKSVKNNALAMAGKSGSAGFLSGLWERMGALYSGRPR